MGLCLLWQPAISIFYLHVYFVHVSQINSLSLSLWQVRHAAISCRMSEFSGIMS